MRFLLTEAICSGRLPRLSILGLCYVAWELHVPHILEHIIAGQVPSLKYLRLVAGPAGSHLQLLQLTSGTSISDAHKMIDEAVLKILHLSLAIWRKF